MGRDLDRSRPVQSQAGLSGIGPSETRRVALGGAGDHCPSCAAGDPEILRARAGSNEALGVVLADCRNYLLLVANSAIGDCLRAKIGASDVVQETFLEAHRIFDRFEGTTQEDLLRWLTRILENKLGTVVKRYAQTAKRNLSREQRVVTQDSSAQGLMALVDQGESPSAVVNAREEALRLADALALLPDHYRQVIDLRIRQQLTFEAIGEQTLRTPEASRKLLARAIHQLQTLMAKTLDDDSPPARA
jgi:RNA polymerase sigma-70 factor (ECF subfamily)